MNVLLTCAGRRNYLVEYFQQALNGRGQVYAADASPYASALQAADHAFIVPSVDQAGYVEHLLDLCATQQVSLLISLNDLELPMLAPRREEFRAVGTMLVVSAPEVIATCFDKWAMLPFLEACQLSGPQTHLTLSGAQKALALGTMQFPLVIKPRWGTASLCIEYAHDLEELEIAYRLVTRRVQRSIIAGVSSVDSGATVLIQERLTGQEYGLDIINDLAGNYVSTIVRRKLAMRSGETDKAMLVDDERLCALGKTLSHALGHIGNLDCDVFVDGSRYTILDMNPRFGGGYPFSHVAGVNLPAALLAWTNGTPPDPNWFVAKPGVVGAKYDHIAIVTTQA